MLARYYTNYDKINLFFEVAEPIIKVETLEELKSNKIFNENELYYFFSVKNYESEEVCEIDFKYYIEIVQTKENFPVEIELYDIESGIELLNKTSKTEMIELNRNEKIKNEYKLVIKGKNIKQSNLEENITINVEVVQK